MNVKKIPIGWTIFSLIVWLHLALELFPLPNQRTEEIQNKAEEVVQASKSLINEGVEPDMYLKMNKGEWESALTVSYWSVWIKTLSLFSIGMLATFFMYRKYKVWPIFLGVVSFAVLFLEGPSIVKITMFSESLSGFIKIWLEHPGNFYHLYVWPCYSALLFGLSIYAPVWRRCDDNA